MAVNQPPVVKDGRQEGSTKAPFEAVLRVIGSGAATPEAVLEALKHMPGPQRLACAQSVASTRRALDGVSEELRVLQAQRLHSDREPLIDTLIKVPVTNSSVNTVRDIMVGELRSLSAGLAAPETDVPALMSLERKFHVLQPIRPALEQQEPAFAVLMNEIAPVVSRMLYYMQEYFPEACGQAKQGNGGTPAEAPATASDTGSKE